jgi:HD-GYP domain-containing protein (c-di-GMP phosphodiesterase class II)
MNSPALPEPTISRGTQQARRIFLSAINSLARTLEARDPYTSGHSLRVRRYALGLARTLGWGAGPRRQLALAARLHDIGKVGLPETILNKPDALTENEQDVVREHPVIGQRILAPIIRNRGVLAAIRGHHERFDGTGYPDGLAGKQIPLLARIISVVDCYDALTSARAYRLAMPRAEALELLRAGAGSQFDPACLLPFLRRMTQRAV